VRGFGVSGQISQTHAHRSGFGGSGSGSLWPDLFLTPKWIPTPTHKLLFINLLSLRKLVEPTGGIRVLAFLLWLLFLDFLGDEHGLLRSRSKNRLDLGQGLGWDPCGDVDGGRGLGLDPCCDVADFLI
jgi:hypothetical protein